MPSAAQNRPAASTLCKFVFIAIDFAGDADTLSAVSRPLPFGEGWPVIGARFRTVGLGLWSPEQPLFCTGR